MARTYKKPKPRKVNAQLGKTMERLMVNWSGATKILDSQMKGKTHVVFRPEKLEGNEKMLEAVITKIEVGMPEWIAEFTKHHVLPRLESEWKTRNYAQHGLQVEAPVIMQNPDGTKKVTGYEYDVWFGSNRQMIEGFNAILSALRGYVPIQHTGKGFVQQVGDHKKIFGMEMAQYSPFRKNGKSNLTSWFLAVELGTGRAENVGAGNVRTSGVTKLSDGSGDWRVGGKFGIVAHGQKGFHLFWNEQRRPAELWVKVFRDELGAFLREKFTTEFNTEKHGSLF